MPFIIKLHMTSYYSPVDIKTPVLFWNVNCTFFVVGIKDFVCVVMPGLMFPLIPISGKNTRTGYCNMSLTY